MIERDSLPAVIVNPSAPLGPGDVRPTPTGRIIVEAMRGNMPAYVDTGLAVVHVADVAAGHLAALQHRAHRRALYSRRRQSRALDAARRGGAPLGRRPPRVRLPRWPLVPLAYANEALARVIGHEPFLNVESLRLSATTHVLRSLQGARELGYRPRPYRHALADAVDWFRAGAKTEPRMLGEARGAHGRAAQI